MIDSMNIERSDSWVFDADLDRRAQVLSALGDPVRLAIVDLLRVRDLSPDALAAAVEIPGNLLAHHLNVLQSAGVIQRTHSQHDRRRTYVQVVEGSLNGLLDSPASIAAPRVVFVCTHNSARSVLAEALWRTVSDIPSASAGSHPAERVNPRAVTAARRAKLEIARKKPESIGEVLRDDDLIVSVCDAVNEELGPVANQRIHWSVPDPSLVDTDQAFTDAVSDLRDRVTHLAPRIHSRTNDRPRRNP
ncbi:MAG: helix-turn-helix domain-containing protein [Actinobacteria bacterium]|nr:helix-turn-helix domain-containing protein [Actinomycetota bacterium]